MNSKLDANRLKEALLLLRVFKFYCACCRKPVRIGKEEIVVSKDFDLYHYSCYLDRATRK